MVELKIYVFVIGDKERAKFDDCMSTTCLGDYNESCVYDEHFHAYVLGFSSCAGFSACTGILCLQGWNFSCNVRQLNIYTK